MLGWIVSGAGMGFVVVALHPFTTYPVSLALLARWRPLRPAAPGPVPTSAALLVCAYNEAPVIVAKAENMRVMRDAVPVLDLLAWVDRSTDGTAAILRSEPGIRVLEAEERRGKTHGMKRLVAATEADIVIFTDANVAFARDCIPRLLAPFSDPSVGLVCGHLIYADPRSPEGPDPMAETGSLFWRLEERIKALEDATGGGVTADGSIFAVRRALYRPAPDDIIDDMYVSLSVLLEGHRIARAADAIATEPPVTGVWEEFRRKRRIACQAYNVHRMLAPRLRRLPAVPRYKYFSHKWLRWWSGPLLAAGGGLMALGLFVAGHGLVATGLVLAPVLVAGAGVAWPKSLAGKLLAIGAAFAATGIGVAESLAGRRYQTWAPPASARVTAS